MTKKHKRLCTTLNYIEHSLILGSAGSGCNLQFCFCFFAWYPIGITSSAIGLKT